MNLLRVFVIAFLIAGFAVNVKPVYALGTPQIVSINPGLSPQLLFLANVADSFSDRDIINIGGNIYVIADRQRRHVPNPETLDALEISRDRINNRGYSDADLNSIPQGPDIPDVVRDPSGFQAFKNWFLSAPTPQQNVASSFSTRDIINIGGNIYVIVDGQRRHVPNPETLDALGISRSMINNRGYSDADLCTIPQGPDIPDVVRDPSGFQAFKNWIFPDLPPIGQPAPTQTQPPQQNGNVADSFNTRDIINIGGNIYVIVDGQRRHVPNPETLDALGIGRDRINNRGYSDSELSTIPQGSDIPDVNKDYQGFMNFKYQYFPNTAPIVTATQPGTSGNCPSAPANIKIGDIAVVTDYQPSRLRIRRQPGLGQEIIGEIPVNGYASIISGPRCVDGYRWWEVGYNGMDGWSAEVGSDGLYNLIPNTTQTQDQPTQVVVQPTLKPSVVETTVPAPEQQITASNQPNQQEVSTQDSLLPAIDNCQVSDSNWIEKLFGITHTDASCTDYVNQASAAIRNCWKGAFPNAGYWDDWAKDSTRSGSCGWTVEPTTSNGINNSKQGDIVVWNGSDQNNGKVCSDADPLGHVALFVSNNYDGTISVNGSNWSGDQTHIKTDAGCMSIIHLNLLQKNQLPTQESTPVDVCSKYFWPFTWFCKWGWIK